MPATPTTAFDRFNDAIKGIDSQIQSIRERFEGRRREIEDEVRKRAQDVQDQLQDSGLYKRAEAARKNIEDRVEEARCGLFDTFGLATKDDVAKLSKKLNSVSRKLNEIAKLAKEREEDEERITH